MALSLNHAFGRRALALVGVGAATALTSWFIYLRNRYLKQITQGGSNEPEPTEHVPARKPATANATTSTNASSGDITDDEVEEEEIQPTREQGQNLQADLQMEALPDGTAVMSAEAASDGSCARRRHHPSPPIVEEEAAAATAASVVEQSAEIRTNDLPQLSPEFIANRLAAMSKSDCANIQLVDGDAAVLARCLRASADAEAARALQLVGRLGQFQHQLDRLSRGGELVAAVCDTFAAAGATGSCGGDCAGGGVEVRLQCLLNLVNLSGVPSNQQAILAIIPSFVDAIPVPRLSQYAQQLLANLALYEQCRPQLLPHLPSFLAELRRQLPPADQTSTAADQRRLRQCLTLLSNLTSDPDTRRQALAAPADCPDPLPAPSGSRALDASDPSVRLAWVCLLANLCREPDCLLRLAGTPGTLAAAFMANLPALSKLAQKQRDKLRSSEKSTEYGQKVTALSKELKALLRQVKVKSK